MTWMHAITWLCGRPTFRWVLVTKAQFARTAHLTGAMIKLKAAKLAAGGAVLVCAGTGALVLPGVIAGGAGRGASRSEQRVDVPEPGTLALLAVGIGGLVAARRRGG